MERNSRIERLQFNLLTLGKVKPGDRINTLGEFINIESTNILDIIARTLSVESRERTLSTLTELVHDTIHVTERIVESKYLDKFYIITLAKNDNSEIKFLETMLNSRIHWLKMLHDALVHSLQGIYNLSETYSLDTNVRYTIHDLLSTIKAHISRLKKIIDDFRGFKLAEIIESISSKCE